MNQTYANFRPLADLYNGPDDFSEAAELYQVTKDPACLAYVFVNWFGYIRTQTEKYFYLTEQDMASFAVEELNKAMTDYRYEGGAQVQTLFSRYLNRRLYAETQMLGHQVRKANSAADSYEVASEAFGGINEDGYDSVASVHDILTSPSLSANEVGYCRIVLEYGRKVSDSEIARLLHITSAAVTYIKQRLEKKLPAILALA